MVEEWLTAKVTVKRYKVVIYAVCFLFMMGTTLRTMFGEDGCCAVARRCNDAAETRFNELERECRETKRHAEAGYESSDKWRDLAMKCISMNSDRKQREVDIEGVIEALRVHDGRKQKKVK